MKKKFLTILLSVFAAFACAFAFVACGDKGNGEGSGDNGDRDNVSDIGGDNNDDNKGNNDEDNDEPGIGIDIETLYKKYADAYYNTDPEYVEEYIVLTEDKIWYDNTGATGKYKISLTLSGAINVNLYDDLSVNNIEYMNGELGETNNNKYISLAQAYTFNEGDDEEIPKCPNSLDYELAEDGDYYIVVGLGSASGAVVVPKRYKFTPVKEIDKRAFYNSKTITSVEVPSCVEKIGNRAFANCSRLTSAKIDAPIDKLTEEFFGSCTNLVDVYIPKTVTEINYLAFHGCDKVENVYYDGSVNDWAQIKFGISSSHASSNVGSQEPHWANPISRSGRKLIINGSTVTSCELDNVSTGAFFMYKYLTEVTVTGNVGDYAFYYSSITSLSADSIGLSACEGCYYLKSFTGGGDKIADKAFYGCTTMTDATIGAKVVEIGEYAFGSCDTLKSITIPASVIKIGKYAFTDGGIEEITFDDATDWQIEQRDGIKSVTQDLTDKQTAARLLTQGQSAYGYGDCDWSVYLYKYTLNSDNASYSVVAGKRLIDKSVNIPSEYNNLPVTAIGDYAFSDFSSLTSIVIPNSITSIGNYAFMGCSSLTSMEMPNSVTRIGSFAFIYCSSLTSIAIPISVKFIGYATFRGCSSLTGIEIPNSVTNIGPYAFADCSSLTNITIPNNVTSIDGYAFYGCSSLTIYCEAANKPSGWTVTWNVDNRPVVWGYKKNG
ncbi:MAG: leucine-rich repeat domain-containing protein [Clostridiales bacterium]|nr:leucine-rich repeat domain-containing protein [Clostridiales bacterium]